MTSKLVITLSGPRKHLTTARMQMIADLVEDLVYAHSHQFTDKIIFSVQ